MQVTSSDLVCRKRVCVGHWLTGARVLLLAATRGRSDAETPGHGCLRYFVPAKDFNPVKFMLAAGAYSWAVASIDVRHLLLLPSSPSSPLS